MTETKTRAPLLPSPLDEMSPRNAARRPEQRGWTIEADQHLDEEADQPLDKMVGNSMWLPSRSRLRNGFDDEGESEPAPV